MSLQLFNFIPKWLLISSVVVFISYTLGVSHGRAPFKMSIKLQQVKTKLVAKSFTQIETNVRQKGQKANETIKTNQCQISNTDARKLSNIRAN